MPRLLRAGCVGECEFQKRRSTTRITTAEAWAVSVESHWGLVSRVSMWGARLEAENIIRCSVPVAHLCSALMSADKASPSTKPLRRQRTSPKLVIHPGSTTIGSIPKLKLLHLFRIYLDFEITVMERAPCPIGHGCKGKFEYDSIMGPCNGYPSHPNCRGVQLSTAHPHWSSHSTLSKTSLNSWYMYAQ